jgi:hypothetical protein
MWAKYLFNKKYPELNSVRLILVIYALGFLYGTKNHLIDIFRDGFFGYTYVSWPINLYWTMLTFLDPLTVFLFIYRPLKGITLAVLIMGSDLLVNLSVTFYFYQQTGIFTDGLLAKQISFGLFVFITSPYVKKKLINFWQGRTRNGSLSSGN